MTARLPLGCVKAVLIDLSGTIHVADNAIPGAVEAISKLRKSQLKIKFVTNTTKESVPSLHSRLNGIGFNIERHEIFSSLTAAVHHLKNNMTECRPHLMVSEDAKKDFECFSTANPNAVVIGLSKHHFNYEPMNTAFNLLLKGCPLIAIHKARYYKEHDGNLTLGPGAFVHGLEYAANTVATVIGKPEKSFFMQAVESIGVAPENCVMIGDDARDDVIGAINAGIMGILVKTGKYKENDEDILPISRAWCVEDIEQAIDCIVDSLV